MARHSTRRDLETTEAKPGEEPPFAPLTTVIIHKLDVFDANGKKVKERCGFYYVTGINPDPMALTGPFKSERKAFNAGWEELQEATSGAAH